MKPILFNTEMVRAIQEGRKTTTRRTVKGYVLEHLEIDTDGSIIGVYDQLEGFVRSIMDYVPYRPSDILYVRETWAEDSDYFYYKANPFQIVGEECAIKKWHPSIHMPKEAARIFLRVKDVRVEKLQDITEEEAIKEGAKGKRDFIRIWNNTIPNKDNQKYMVWSANPWVWVIEFERITREEATLNETSTIHNSR